jgi:hypothetical protein
LYTPLLSPIRAACPAHLILLALITQALLGEEYRLVGSSVCSFFPLPCYLIPFRPKYTLPVIIHNIHLCCSVFVDYSKYNGMAFIKLKCGLPSGSWNINQNSNMPQYVNSLYCRHKVQYLLKLCWASNGAHSVIAQGTQKMCFNCTLEWCVFNISVCVCVCVFTFLPLTFCNRPVCIFLQFSTVSTYQL